MSNVLARKEQRLMLLESLLRKLVNHSWRSCDPSSLYARMRELIIETQCYDSSNDVFSMYLIIETKYICQKQDKQHNE